MLRIVKLARAHFCNGSLSFCVCLSSFSVLSFSILSLRIWLILFYFIYFLCIYFLLAPFYVFSFFLSSLLLTLLVYPFFFSFCLLIFRFSSYHPFPLPPFFLLLLASVPPPSPFISPFCVRIPKVNFSHTYGCETGAYPPL